MQTHPSYEILQEIGRGPEATVYRARDVDRNRIVAIKEFDPRWAQAKAQPFWDAAQSLADLAHENIVKVYAVDKERGWLILEMLPGGLNTRLPHGPLPPDLVRGILRQALQGLQFLHQRHQLHGAIKPSNLFLPESGQVKIGDPAGVSAAGTLSRRAGTCKYLAPELFNPEFGPIGPGVDLYSLGFVALELLKGPGFDQLFMDHGSTKEIDPEGCWLRLHSSTVARMPGVREVLPGAPEDLVRVIDRLLQREVSRRYRSASEALGDLDTCPVPGMGAPLSSSGRRSATPVVPSSQVAVPLGLSDTNIPMVPPQPTRARNPLSTRPIASRPRLFRILEKPLVLYPLCALIILITAGLLFYYPVPADAENNLVRVRIESQPEGARVVLDDREIQPNKEGVLLLMPSEYVLRLELDKHKPLEQTIEIKPDRKEQAFPFTLEKEEPEFKVRLESDPKGASVFIDGSYRPGLTDDVWLLKAGKHRVLVVHPEKGIDEKEVIVPADSGAAPQTVLFKPVPEKPGRPRALVVGIQDYGGALPAFRHGAGDAIDLAHTLRAVGYKDDDVVLMTQPHGHKNPGQMPTAQGIRRELNKLNDCTGGDTVLVALAGLVIQIPGAKGYAFCPANADPARPETLLPLEELFGALKKEKCRAGTKMVLLDGAPRFPKVDQIAFPGPSFDPDTLLVPDDVLVACSCLAGQNSYIQADYRRGAFVDAVIHGLWGAADDNQDCKITEAELRDYIDKQMPDYVHGHHDGAEQHPRWLGESKPTKELAWPPRALASLGEVDAALDNTAFAKAETALKEVLQLHPLPLEALVKQAELQLKQKHFPEALTTCSEAEKREPNLAVIHVYRGDALWAKDNYSKAIPHYTQALELDPYQADAYNTRGSCNYGLNNYKEAVKDFERAIELVIKPDPILFHNLASAHIEIGDFDKAIKACDKAIKLRKDYYQAHTTRGIAFNKQNKPRSAKDCFTEAIKWNSSYWPAFEHRAEAYRKMGDKENAKKDEEQARRLKGNPKR